MFLHLSTNGRLGCFNLLAIVNSAAMNLGVQIAVLVPAIISLEYIYILGNTVTSTFNFLRNHHSTFYSICTILHSYQQCPRVPVSLHLIFKTFKYGILVTLRNLRPLSHNFRLEAIGHLFKCVVNLLSCKQ